MRRITLALALAVALALTTIPTLPARAAGGIGQFVLRCLYSHSLMDDPIMAPGQPGAFHMHDFFGNTSVNAYSTMESMLAGGTTCRVPSDTAGYWAPTAYLNGVRITPTVMRIYYLGSRWGKVETFPPGLQIVAGNRDATSPEENPHVAWYCGATKDVKTPRMGEPYDCTPWASHTFVDGVIAIVDFPNCWNGSGLRPEDVAYPVNGVCPVGFRHVLPRISERVHYGIMNPTNPDGSLAFTLSSGPTYSLHADFWNTWQQDRLDQLVSDCIVARVHCGSVDATSRVEWARQFGTAGSDRANASAPDGEGGTYVAGLTDPPQGSPEAFLRRYDARGRALWSRTLGTRGVDGALAISVAGDDVYVAGTTDGRFRRQHPSGGADAWVARFDADGSRIWIRQFGTARDDRATALAATSTGVFVAGATTGRLPRERRFGGSDAFVMRITAPGDTLWTHQMGGGGEDAATAIAVRGGVPYVAGSTQGFGKVPGDLDAFVASLAPSGVERWHRTLGNGSVDDAATSLVVRTRAMFLAGWTAGVLPAQASAGGMDAFVAKLQPNGTHVWVRQFGSSGDDQVTAATAVGKGVYVAGSTTGVLPDGSQLGGADAFVRKYSPRFGTAMWTMQLGTDLDDGAFSISGDRGGVTLVGATQGSFEGLTNVGDHDAFLTRIAFT